MSDVTRNTAGVDMQAEVFDNINKITEDELSDDLYNKLNNTELKETVAELEDGLNSHISNQKIHVSDDDRVSWDGKAPKNSPTFTGDPPIIPYITELDNKNPESMSTVEWNAIKSKSVSLESLKKYLSYDDDTTGLDHLVRFSITGGGTAPAVETDFKTNSDIALNLTEVAANILTGTVQPGRLSGNYDITVTNSNKLAGLESTYYAPIQSPSFTGTPIAPTPSVGDNSQRLATTEFVSSEITRVSNSGVGAANKLTNPQRVTITGKVTGEATTEFDGTGPINIVATDVDISQYNDLLFQPEYKEKLEGIEAGANKYVHPATHPASMITGLHSVATSGNYDELNGLPEIPTKTSDLINDSNFVTSEAGGQVESAIKDSAGNTITDTYIKNISISNGDLVFTLGNNTNKTVDITLPADTIQGLADVATTGDYNDLINAPSFTQTFTTGEYGQVLKINRTMDDIIADDNFHVLRVVASSEDQDYYMTISGVSMSDLFNNWIRITDYNKAAAAVWQLANDWSSSNTGGYKDGQNVTDDGSASVRNNWTFDSSSNTIKNNGNYHLLQAFVSKDVATTYSMKCRVRYVDDDDDLFAIIIAYMVDENGVHHHISMARNLSVNNQNPYKFSLWYDLYNSTQKLIYDATSQVTNPSGVSGTKDNYIDVNIIKKETSIVCQSSDYSKTIGGDLKYSFTWNLPSSKPDGWTDDMWDNVQKMMSLEGAQYGVGSVSQDVAFTITESVGLFADNKIYNLASDTLYDFVNGEYTVTGTVSGNVPYRTFLYNEELGQLFFFVKPYEYYQIATGSGGGTGGGGGSSANASNDGLGQNIANTYIKAIQYYGNTLNYTKGNNDVTELTITLPASAVTGLATVATSGSYTDLSNKPTIPTKLSDLTNDTGFVSGVGGTVENATNASNDANGNKIDSTYVKSLSYANDTGILKYAKGDDIETSITINLPVNNVTGISTVGKTNSYNDLSDRPTIPTKLSELANDVGFVTSTSGTIENAINAEKATSDANGNNISATYLKEISYNVGTGYLSYTNGDDVTNQTILLIPVDNVNGISKVAKSGDYNDLENLPAIPTKLSELVNDANYIKADENNEYNIDNIVSETIVSNSVDTDSLSIGDWKLVPTTNGLEIQYQGTTKGTLTTSGQFKVSELIEE